MGNPIKKLSDSKCMIGGNEYEIDKAAIYRDPKHYRSFIYVEVKAENPIELPNQDIKKSIQLQLEYKPYASQSYVLYRNSPITIEEYEDGAAIINGDIVDLKGETEYRTRFLTKHNFILCAQSSVYNSTKSDVVFGNWMNERLRGRSIKLEVFLPRLLELGPSPFYEIDFCI